MNAKGTTKSILFINAVTFVIAFAYSKFMLKSGKMSYDLINYCFLKPLCVRRRDFFLLDKF